MNDDARDWKAEQADEARRWQPFVDAFLERVPEIRASLEEDRDPETTRPFTPLDIWNQGMLDLLDRDYYPQQLDRDVWPRVLAFLEVAEELEAQLKAELGDIHDDTVTVFAFADASILCDVTENAAGLQELLPLDGTAHNSSCPRGDRETYTNTWLGQREN